MMPRTLMLHALAGATLAVLAATGVAAQSPTEDEPAAGMMEGSGMMPMMGMMQQMSEMMKTCNKMMQARPDHKHAVPGAEPDNHE